MHSVRILRRCQSCHIFRNVKSLSTNTSNIVQNFNAEIANGGTVPGFKLAPIFNNRLAVQDCHGKFTYYNLFKFAKKLSLQLDEALNGQNQKTVSYLCNGDSTHIIVQWAIWMSGNIAVPLSIQHPPPLIEYYLQDSGSSLVICDEKLLEKLPDSAREKLKVIDFNSSTLLKIEPEESPGKNEIPIDILSLYENLPDARFYANSDALIIYTSGTTSKPKGVVHGFKQISSQISSLHNTWKYSCNDVLLHTLPLHHIHGQINSVAAALSSGAMLRMIPSFNPATVWSHILGIDKNDHKKVNVFMGVPTMYMKLIDEYDKVLAKNKSQKEYIKSVLTNKMRLMISGSSSLPSAIFDRWEEISGHKLLERYGMSEIGMALSNPYEPMSERSRGYVGLPMPNVHVQIANVDTKKNITPLIQLEMPTSSLQIDLNNYNLPVDGEEVKNLFADGGKSVKDESKCKITYLNGKSGESISGELLVKGNNVFKYYWKRDEQTKAAFTSDGWFMTGDSACFENGKIKILGRSSVDIIKSGGYKISALEVETAILEHPDVADVAVIGMPDVTWGEKVTALIEMKKDKTMTLKELQEFAVQFIPKYQLPNELYIVVKIPRNVMGKVNKNDLRKNLTKIIEENKVKKS